MELPSAVPRPAPPAAAPDRLRRLWGPVTIRVAWELLRARVDVRPATLRAARDHALWRVPSEPGVAEAEAIAVAAVDEYLARCTGQYTTFQADSDLTILPIPAWREALLQASEREHAEVIRLHYADGLSLEEVQQRTGIEVALLRGARDAVRELLRAIVGEDDVPVDGWEPARLDRLLCRVANASGDQCPGPGGLATEIGRAHATGCPRCSRALRMFREGVLSPGDLFPPEDGRCLPSNTIDLACVEVHPDARKKLRGLVRALGAAARPIAGDLLLVDASQVDLHAVLAAHTQRGSPPAAQLRVVRATVPGRWTARAVIGPGVDTLLARAQHIGWGEVEGIEVLPEPLPPAPSAARWWASAGLAALLAGAAGVWALGAHPRAAPLDLRVESTAGGVVFDADETAWIDIVALHGARPEVVFHSTSTGDKGALALGDGRYRYSGSADAYVVVASPVRLDGVERVLEVLPASSEHPAALLAERLRERYANAAVQGVP